MLVPLWLDVFMEMVTLTKMYLTARPFLALVIVLWQAVATHAQPSLGQFRRMAGVDDVRWFPCEVLPTYGGVVWCRTTLLVSRSALACPRGRCGAPANLAPFGHRTNFSGPLYLISLFS